MTARSQISAWCGGLALAAGLVHGAFAAAAVANVAPNADQIKRGEYLAKAADCIACHTVDPAKPFAGGYPLATPFGTIYGPNITADKETGIGDWSDEQFVRALHEGIDDEGKRLYPAFPYASFTKLSRDDVLAIKAYLFSLPPIQQKTPENKLPFPLNQRWLMAGWNLFNFTPGELQADAAKSPEWNRGNYLVNGLAHCQECHTPRNLTMGLDLKRSFGGAQLGGWTAFNISPDPVSGVGGWKDEELVQYLKTGLVPGKASAAGGMAEAIEHSLQYLTDDDLKSIVTYLRSAPAVNDAADKKPRYAWGQPADDDAEIRGIAAVSVSSNASSGAELFSGNCASCHSASGSGVVGGYYPSLFNNSVVGARDPGNLLMVILNGVQRRGAKEETFMPGFADHLNDGQIAMLANYAVKQYGHADTPPITPEQVKIQRQGGPASPLTTLMPAGLAGLALIVVFILFSIFRRGGRRQPKQS
ncbi:mono/diheme cytochrome c family protein [Collimonas sp. PA-H2]|uniref:c-type cytochrome n=1 Tax=Collimonas sp. PA-H2 TaxID=1881062 RepID=UPI000BF71543|nr:cytochrome c [Collimonas sp. PA-H2]PFH09690.1 mono/diheme cytochrome c family protein [Collimonas sp. PA-H2]